MSLNQITSISAMKSMIELLSGIVQTSLIHVLYCFIFKIMFLIVKSI